MKPLKIVTYWTKDILIFLSMQLIIGMAFIRPQIFHEYSNIEIILAVILAGLPFYLITKLYKKLKAVILTLSHLQYNLHIDCISVYQRFPAKHLI